MKKHHREINGFWWSKTIEKYWKTNTFLDFRSFKKKQWKNDTKGDFKSHVFVSKMATCASQVRLIVWFLTFCCDAKNSSFLDAFPMYQKIEKIDPWSTKGPKKVPAPSPGVSFLARRVPRAASRARTSEEKNDRGADEQLVRDLTRHGPMAWRIKHINV